MRVGRQYQPRAGQAEKRERAARMIAEGRSISSVARELGTIVAVVSYWIRNGMLRGVPPEHRTERQDALQETRLGLPARFEDLIREGKTREEAEDILGVTRRRTDGWIRYGLVDARVVPPSRPGRPGSGKCLPKKTTPRVFPRLPVSGMRSEFLPGMASGLILMGSTMVEVADLARAARILRDGGPFAEAAAILRVSPNLLRVWARKGLVPGFSPGSPYPGRKYSRGEIGAEDIAVARGILESGGSIYRAARAIGAGENAVRALVAAGRLPASRPKGGVGKLRGVYSIEIPRPGEQR